MFENGFRTITDYVIHLWSWNFIHLLPMSQGCALLILGSKGQRSRSWIIDVWKWFPDHNWLCNPPMIMKLHTLAPHESRMCPIDFGVKGQGHGLSMFENGFRTITDYVIHLWSWNFIHLLPMSQGCALLILGSKGQGHGLSMFENGFRTITDYVIHLWSWNFIHLLLNFWVALYPCTNESRMFNSCLYKVFLQLGFLHLWCTLYLSWFHLM